MAKNRTDDYEAMGSARNHVLHRPGMWIGDCEVAESIEYVATREYGTFRITKRPVEVSAGLLRIFVEVLSNAIDNVTVSEEHGTPCTKIKISIDEETGETSVWNDGKVIPIEKKKDGRYIHSIVFGEVFTGSNYNDKKDRTVSGTNGVGIKAVNIMSTEFTVEGADPETNQTLKQTWTDNMGQTKGPIVKTSKAKTVKGFTKVTWTPDFPRFGLEGYTKDIISQYTKFIVDAAMLTGKVQVLLNDERIAVKSLKDYAVMYGHPLFEDQDENNEIIEVCRTDDTQVVLTPANSPESISFVNGVHTRDGGQHVEAWTEALLRPVLTKLNKRFDAENKEREKKGAKSKAGINMGDLKQYFRIFVVTTLVRPVFNSQDKHFLVKPKAKDIPTVSLKTAQVNTVCGWSVMQFVNAILDAKEMAIVNKTLNTKRGFTAIEGLIPANKAGTKYSQDCTLVLCEGLSAKNYVTTALKLDTDIDGKCGSDWFGIYPLRGKIKNTQGDSVIKTSKNKVVMSIVQAMGLDFEANYLDDAAFKKLKYGKVMIMTDADKDGIHIHGLIMNFFLTTFPTLCQRPDPVISSMMTPIVRIKVPRQPDMVMFDEHRYKQLEESGNLQKAKVIYYKGLASSRAEDVAETFNKKRVLYHCDENASMTMLKCFHNDFSDYRKGWIDSYIPGQGESLDDVGPLSHCTYSDFCNNSLITHSVYNAERMIPHLMDGLVTARRKVLFTVMDKGLHYNKDSFKVDRLAAAVAERTAYHHGEGNLTGVITGMANDYVGGNNIPLLDRDGLFGTRNHGGHDAGQGRYIHTRMDKLTHLIFRSEDNPVLTYLMDDGRSVEPMFYVPIIPMALVNGCEGIGTGYACSIPMFNPIDLVNAVKTWINLEGEVIMEDEESGERTSAFDELMPWYREFKGTIERDPDPKKSTRYVTTGICERIAANKVVVSELPINMWTDDFKTWCDKKREDKKIGVVTQQVSDRDVHFEITELDEGLSCTTKNMKLTSYLHTSSMSLWGSDSKIRQYQNIDLILDEFCRVRYEYYVKRKRHVIGSLEHEIMVLENKKRYIGERLNKKLIVEKRPLQDVVDEMEDSGYYKQGNISDECGGYAYLLDMGDRQRTAEKIDQLKKSIAKNKEKLAQVLNTTEFEMWDQELDEFTDAYGRWVVHQQQLYARGSAGKKTGSKAKNTTARRKK